MHTSPTRLTDEGFRLITETGSPFDTELLYQGKPWGFADYVTGLNYSVKINELNKVVITAEFALADIEIIPQCLERKTVEELEEICAKWHEINDPK